MLVLAASTIVTVNDPGETGSDVIFTPLLFAIAWLGGFALRERAQEAEAAEARAELAERERKVAARIAVAEERSRSARRVVEASDAERRRLERDLHDGAQSRLVALALKLQLARRQADGRPELEELLDESAAELALSLDELRELARGIHPAVLSDRGLAAALEALATRAPVPVEIRPAPPDDLPEPVETAVYFVVAEALTNVAKYARAEHAHVAVRRDGDVVVAEIADDGVGGADLAGGSGSVASPTASARSTAVSSSSARAARAPGCGWRFPSDHAACRAASGHDSTPARPAKIAVNFRIAATNASCGHGDAGSPQSDTARPRFST